MTVVNFPSRGRFASPAYQIGDIVELVVGSPHMVVIDVCDEYGDVETAYTDSDGDVVFNTFPVAALVPAE